MDIDLGMAKRFASIRKIKGFTQIKLSELLKIDRSTISNLENGIVPLTDRNINMICLTLNVNENWLRTGQGDMFFQNEMTETPEELELIDIYRDLEPVNQKLVIDHSRALLKSQHSLLGKDTEKESHPVHE